MPTSSNISNRELAAELIADQLEDVRMTLPESERREFIDTHASLYAHDDSH